MTLGFILWRCLYFYLSRNKAENFEISKYTNNMKANLYLVVNNTFYLKKTKNLFILSWDESEQKTYFVSNVAMLNCLYKNQAIAAA